MNVVKMNFLFLSWRDIKSPKSGGAEVHTHGLMKCFVAAGCRVVHLSPRYKGLPKQEIVDGILYQRKGGIISVILYAFLFYIKNRRRIDYVVDQCNTHRFFTGLWVPHNKRIFYIHQLTREIWDLNLPLPFGILGRKAETMMLKLQKKDITITVSQSTKKDLIDVGFDARKIFIIPNAVPDEILGNDISDIRSKSESEFIYVGRYSRYKGIDAAITAIGIARKTIKAARLHIVGRIDEKIVEEVISPAAEKYGFSYGPSDDNDVILHGFVGEEEKYALMKMARALLFPSMREGWGIIVTEAAALGTPSIVYDSPGCCDAVDNGNAGYLCEENNPDALAEYMVSCVEDEYEYRKKRQAAYDFAQGFSWTSNQELVNSFILLNFTASVDNTEL